MLELHYTYGDLVRNSERVSWKVDDVMPPGTRLDYTRPFLPDALSGTSRMGFLNADGRLKLNQIMGNSYLNLFAFVEEYILAQASNHAQAEMFGDHDALRALLRFADEEIKHQQLFWRYREAFDRDFGTPCGVLGAAAEVANVVLSKSPMAVLLTTFHLELMTQQHYTECVRDDSTVDPFFASLLHHHWLEEAQHARIDALEMNKLAQAATPQVLDAAFADYLELVTALDGLLRQQAALDAESLAAALGRPLSATDEEKVTAVQHENYRRTFLTYGMTNRMFAQVVGRLSAAGARSISERARSLESPS
jgi:hypothetical protein